MNPTHIIQLGGCSPIPLAHYLKALGVLRLVAEQADPGAAGCWNRDRFDLHTKLEREELIEFFLHEYEPTPILAPWNGGSGFYRKDNDKAIWAIEQGGAARLTRYRAAIGTARQAILDTHLADKPSAEEKELLLLALRNRLPEEAVAWLDAAYVLTGDGAKYPPLLGTGGNDGRLEFTNNFMQRLGEVMEPLTGAPTGGSANWLRKALLADPCASKPSKAPVGQFFPWAAGGPNATSGFDAPSAVNPWDYILMLEGAVLFAAASVKRLERGEAGQLAYPFCVRQTGVGYASASFADEAGARAEMWLPLWARPTTLSEIRTVFSEGRAEVRGRPARSGVDFARAVVSLGVDRGLSAFQRYGFQVRNGLAYFATPLDRVAVQRNARVDLLTEVDVWFGNLRRAAGPSAKPPAPASVSRAMNRLEAQILGLCQQNDAARLQSVLIALGRCERTLACSQRWAKGEDIKPPQIRVRPLAGLSSRWLLDGDTGSVEYRLAAAVASLGGRYGKKPEDWLPLRCHLEPVESPRAGWLKWAENATNDVQWSQAPLPSILNAIFSRRLLRAEQAGTSGLPDSARVYASLADIAAFIKGETDDELLADLIWGLSLLDWSNVVRMELPGGREPDVAPSLYALLKLCFWPNAAHDEAVPLVPAIHRRAAAGDGAAASELASRRLRSSGLRPALTGIPLRGAIVQRTAAALLFPLQPSQRAALGHAVLRPAEITPVLLSSPAPRSIEQQTNQ
jgi:CRISPR-associated protein Csx17